MADIVRISPPKVIEVTQPDGATVQVRPLDRISVDDAGNVRVHRPDAPPRPGRRWVGLLKSCAIFAALIMIGITNAAADPCEGELPRQAGVQISGTVRHVIDGDGWCIGQSDDPATWIEVRSSDFDAAELRTPQGRRGRDIAERILLNRNMTCVSSTGRDGRTVVTYDRVFAVCSIEGRRVSSTLRDAGVPEGGN